ncbi:MAG: ATP-binding protein, partial [Muribaculaceae bacterium]|nr:ATP-binding protein [Muribaculaceae bacterium]
MNSQTVEITSAGIRKILNKYTPERAISEYIWNGFDAKATVVYIDFDIDSSDLDTVKRIRISDNGTGINHSELSFKFKKIYESQKRISTDNNDITRGKNGYGRFTFYKFARNAKWETIYRKGNEAFTYDIKISSETLKDYSTSDPQICDHITGTIVTFEEITSDISSTFVEKVLIPYLKAEFAWFLA